MKTYNIPFIVIFFLTFCFTSCNSEDDISIQDRDKLLVYLQAGYHRDIGLINVNIVNGKLEDSQANLAMVRATRNVNSNVNLTMSASEDSTLVNYYREKTGNDYQLLPNEVYTLKNTDFNIKAGQSIATDNLEIEWKSNASELIGNGGIYLLPFTVSGFDKGNTNAELSANRTVVFLEFHFIDVKLGFEDTNKRFVDIELIPNNAGSKISSNDLKLNVGINSSINVDVDAAINIDNDLIDEYNSLNSTNYSPVPEQWYTLSKDIVNIASGELSEEQIHVSFLDSASFEAGQYMIPVRLINSSLTLNENADRVYILVNIYENNINSGIPVTGTKVDRTNWNLKVSSTLSPYYGNYRKENMIDSDKNTSWSSSFYRNNQEQTISLDLGAEITVKGFELSPMKLFNSMAYNSTKISVYTSSDGIDWKNIGTFKRDLPTSVEDTSYISFYNPVASRYFKFEMNIERFTGASEINAIE